MDFSKNSVLVILTKILGRFSDRTYVRIGASLMADVAQDLTRGVPVKVARRNMATGQLQNSDLYNDLSSPCLNPSTGDIVRAI